MMYGQEFAAQLPSTAARRPRQHAVVFSGNGYNAAYEVGVLKALGTASPLRLAKKRSSRTLRWHIGRGLQRGLHGLPLGGQPHRGRENWSRPGRRKSAPLPRQPVRLPRSAVLLAQPGGSFRGSRQGRGLCTPAISCAGSATSWPRSTLTRPIATVQQQILDYEWDILADIAPMSSLIRNHIALDNIRSSNKKLCITAANWKRGNTRTFENRDFTDEAGYQVITAAMAIPGAVPAAAHRPRRLRRRRHARGAPAESRRSTRGTARRETA